LEICADQTGSGVGAWGWRMGQPEFLGPQTGSNGSTELVAEL